MSKRKSADESKDLRRKRQDEDEMSDDEELDLVNVNFEWFDPQPEHDTLGLKSLCRQLFDVDAQLFDLSALVQLILSQPLLGSTVKVDGNESDPYAFLTVLNLHVHRDHSAIASLSDYLRDKSKALPALANLTTLLSPSSAAQVGLILTERLINMPAEIAPPMFTMLLEEVEWANQEKEPYEFSHYLILSKTYKEVQSKLDYEHSRPSKKKRKETEDNTFYFHPEDEVLHNHALGHGNFDYSTPLDEGSADSRRVFQDMGIVPQGHLILIERARFPAAVKAMEEFLRPPS